MGQKTNVSTTDTNDTVGISMAGSANAPFLYFDQASTFGHASGVLQVTLEALRLYPDPPGVKRERVVVAHLRMNIPAARHLLSSLERALALVAPAQPDTTN